MADAGDDPQLGSDPDPAPRARLMHEVAQQMDAIEADFPDGFEIGRVVTIAEIVLPEGRIELRVRAGQLPWVTLGILDWAKKNIEDATRRPAPEE
jgi:hypothetical protein